LLKRKCSQKKEKEKIISWITFLKEKGKIVCTSQYITFS